MKKIKLSDQQIKNMKNLPETGMGYHKVKIIFKDGEELTHSNEFNLTVENSEFLLIESSYNININDIETIETI